MLAKSLVEVYQRVVNVLGRGGWCNWCEGGMVFWVELLAAECQMVYSFEESVPWFPVRRWSSNVPVGWIQIRRVDLKKEKVVVWGIRRRRVFYVHEEYVDNRPFQRCLGELVGIVEVRVGIGVEMFQHGSDLCWRGPVLHLNGAEVACVEVAWVCWVDRWW